mgnify:CR=1 FL=1
MWITDGVQYGFGTAIAVATLLALGGIAIYYARREERSLFRLRAVNILLEERVEEREVWSPYRAQPAKIVVGEESLTGGNEAGQQKRT